MTLTRKTIAIFTLVCSAWLAGIGGGTIEKAQACSNVLLNSKEYIVSGRTMDFDVDLQSEVVVVPAGQVIEFKDDTDGKVTTYKSKYGFVGVNAFHLDRYVDGLNEKGLSVAGLWLPETKYPNPKDYPGYDRIPVDYVSGWILGNFATVGEVKQALQENAIITGSYVKQIKMTPPLHLAIHDENGGSIVVECLNGKINIHDNSDIKVLTNDPDYTWHLANLKKYDHYTNKLTSDDVQVKDDKRFVEAYFLNKFINPPSSQQAALADMTAIMNKVAVVRGEALAGESTYANLGAFNYTLWTVIRDHKNKVFYFNDADNLSLRSIDLKKVNLTEKAPILKVKLASGEYHQPMEGMLK